MVNYKGPEFLLIKKILKQNPEGMSVSGIARALGKNKNTTGRYLDILLISGQVDMRTYGMAKVYTLSQRVPLAAMLSYSKDMILVLDRDSRIVQINDNFLAFLHRARDEIAGKNIASIPLPDFDLQDFLLSSVPPPTEETERIVSARVNGNAERIFRQKAIPTVFEDGSRGITYALSDITADVLREREIQIREERFRMMTENIQDALFIIENEKCTFVNRRLAEITGYTFEEFWDMDPAKIIVPEDREKIQQILDPHKYPVYPAPGPIGFQCRIQRKDGVIRHVYIRITSLAHGTSVYHFVIMTDVTELLFKDDALEKSEQRFRMMAEHIQDALFIIESGRITYANRRACEISGYSLEELQAAATQDLIVTSDTRQAMDERYKKSLECPGCGEKFQSWLTRKDGEKRCLYGQMNTLSQEDKVITYVTVTDVTAFAEHEQALNDRIAALECMRNGEEFPCTAGTTPDTAEQN